MTEIIPRCNWLMLGQERTCNRLAKRKGYFDYHAKRKVKLFPCMSCGKGTSSSVHHSSVYGLILKLVKPNSENLQQAEKAL